MAKRSVVKTRKKQNPNEAPIDTAPKNPMAVYGAHIQEAYKWYTDMKGHVPKTPHMLAAIIQIDEAQRIEILRQYQLYLSTQNHT